jgi:hypothetical protein
MHANRYQFPGFELVNCPRPLANGNNCGAGILVEIDRIQNSTPGRVIIRCDQTIQCQRKSCYHCHGLIGRASSSCDTCVNAIENTNPNAFNHYFHRIGKTANDGQMNLLRNAEITVQMASNQVMEMIRCDKMVIKCTECLTVLMKTEQCNTLDHCGIERCYSCGRSGTKTQKLGDHWDSSGVKGCPRFDHSVFWNMSVKSKFLCVEGENGCYGDQIGDCVRVAHSKGIEEMIRLRRLAHVYHALKSLLPNTREETIQVLALIPEARKWLPKWKSSDYRTYLPESSKHTVERALQCVQNTAHDSLSFKVANDFLQRTALVHFDCYDDLPPLPIASVKMKEKEPKYRATFHRLREKYAKK